MSSKVSKPSHSAGTKPTHTRASVACINCRLRKIKCDVQNQRPGSDCTPCRNSHAPCYTDSGGDRRKRRGVGENLSAVHSRLAELEELLRGHGTRNVDPNKEQQQQPQQQPASSPDQNARVPALSGTSPPLITPNPEQPPDAGPESTEMGGASLLVEPSAGMRDGQPTMPSPDFSSLVGGCQDMFTMMLDSTERSIATMDPPVFQLHDIGLTPPNDTISQLCMPQPSLFSLVPPRMKDTQTSDFNTQHSFPHVPQPSLLPNFDDSTSLIAEDTEDGIFLNADSVELRKVLLQIFWDVHPCGILVVDKERFMRHRPAGKRNRYYSTFLENAILANASRVSTSSSIRRLGAEFLERAQAEVVSELEKPNLASMQGLNLLSECVGIRGNDRLSWMYCGMACRLVFDLGLLNKTSDLVDEEGDPVDATHNISAFLSTFVFDQNLSLYFGRPHSMTLSQLRSALEAAQDTSVAEILQAWSLLSVQVSRLTDVLNSATSADVTNQLQLFPKLAKELDDCYDNLPARLKYDDSLINDLEASSYALNLQFCGARIILHRLWNKLREPKEETSNTAAALSGVETEQQKSMNQSAWIIYCNAIRVAELVRTYKLIYGLEKLVTVMLINTCWATTALASHILSPPTYSPPFNLARKNTSSDSDTDVYWLKFLWRTLEEAQGYYPLAGTILTTFARLMEGTHLHATLRARRYSNNASSSPAANSTSSNGNKARSSAEALMHDVSYGLGSSLKSNPASDDMFVDLSMIDNSWIFNQHEVTQMGSAC